VKVSVECNTDELNGIDENMTGEKFAWKFEKAVQIATVDTYRAATHNKGIFNGIDAVALATGNDFRAIEACGHTYAAKDGKYKSLTDIQIKNGKFKYTLTVPVALGTIGGLTTLHPLAKKSLELLGNPGASDLMRIAASVGLANNFGAIKSLVTKGIQKVIATDISKDGMLTGPAFELYREILDQFPGTELIASGGVSSMKDIEQLSTDGLSGVIVGKAIYEGQLSLKEINRYNLATL